MYFSNNLDVESRIHLLESQLQQHKKRFRSSKMERKRFFKQLILSTNPAHRGFLMKHPKWVRNVLELHKK